MAEVASAFVSLVPSARGFGRATDKQIGGQVANSGKTAGKRFGGVFAGTFAALATTGAVVKTIRFLGDSIAEAREAQKVTGLTAAVIKSTGGAANVTASQVARLSTALSLKTGIDDEVIQSGQNMLLTFRNIRNEAGKGNDVFNQASKSLVDMAAALGKDPKTAAIQLGKALNDPIKGITALGRAGVQFTDGQKKQIAAMVKSGNVLGAQKIILGELNKEFGGAAAAQATAGDKARVAMANLKETIGGALVPVVDRLSNLFTNSIAPAITRFVTGMQNGTGAGGRFAAVLGPIGAVVRGLAGFFVQHLTTIRNLTIAMGLLVAVTQIHAAVLAVSAAGGLLAWVKGTQVAATVTKAWAAVQWVLNAALSANPIGLVVIAIAALVIGLIYAYKHSETFRNIVNAAFAAVKAVVASVVGWFGKYVPRVFSAVVSLVRGYINVYRTVIVTAFNVVKAAAGAVGRAISAAMSAIRAAFTTVVAAAGRLARGVKANISDAIGFIRSIPGKAKSALGNLGSTLFNAGEQLIQGLINGISRKIGAAVQKVKDGLAAIKRLLPGSPIKDGPLKAWNNTGATGPGGRLMGLLADGVSNSSALDRAMSSNLSRLTVPRAPHLSASPDVVASGQQRGGVTQYIYETTDARATARESARQMAWAG